MHYLLGTKNLFILLLMHRILYSSLLSFLFFFSLSLLFFTNGETEACSNLLTAGQQLPTEGWIPSWSVPHQIQKDLYVYMCHFISSVLLLGLGAFCMGQG